MKISDDLTSVDEPATIYRGPSRDGSPHWSRMEVTHVAWYRARSDTFHNAVFIEWRRRRSPETTLEENDWHTTVDTEPIVVVLSGYDHPDPPASSSTTSREDSLRQFDVFLDAYVARSGADILLDLRGHDPEPL